MFKTYIGYYMYHFFFAQFCATFGRISFEIMSQNLLNNRTNEKNVYMTMKIQKLTHLKWKPAHYDIYLKLCFSGLKLTKECVGYMHFGVGLFLLAKKKSLKKLVFFEDLQAPHPLKIFF